MHALHHCRKLGGCTYSNAPPPKSLLRFNRRSHSKYCSISSLYFPTFYERFVGDLIIENGGILQAHSDAELVIKGCLEVTNATLVILPHTSSPPSSSSSLTSLSTNITWHGMGCGNSSGFGSVNLAERADVPACAKPLIDRSLSLSSVQSLIGRDDRYLVNL